MSRGQRNGSLWPYSRLSRPEPLLFLPKTLEFYSQGWVDPVPDAILLRKTCTSGNWTRTSVARNYDHTTTEAVIEKHEIVKFCLLMLRKRWIAFRINKMGFRLVETYNQPVKKTTSNEKNVINSKLWSNWKQVYKYRPTPMVYVAEPILTQRCVYDSTLTICRVSDLNVPALGVASRTSKEGQSAEVHPQYT
jgi:hypothetical protein